MRSVMITLLKTLIQYKQQSTIDTMLLLVQSEHATEHLHNNLFNIKQNEKRENNINSNNSKRPI